MTMHDLSSRQPDDDVVLRVEHLRKTYGSTVAVADMSFELHRGESLGVVGESGSGKSTTARMVVGLELPDSGTVELPAVQQASRDTGQRLARARAVQMIFQDPYQSFDPRLRIADAIEEPLRLHFQMSSKEREDRVAELLEQVGLTVRQGRAQPRELSGGMRQRAAIARALGIKPSVLVLDEAVAALDVSIQAQVIALLNQIRAEGQVAFIFVSHDLGVVRYMTDRSIVMRHGDVVDRGETERLLADPQHPYTRLLLDSVPTRGWDLDRLAQDRRELASLSADVDRRNGGS
ncbi:MAG: ABC transporter ATP-binding protein [Dehalococcoidia bacterium]|jgi:ABC-type glutathione transport system ATPase component